MFAFVLLTLCGARAFAGLPSCTRHIAAYYQLPVVALEAIHDIEGGQDDLSVPNDNGSFDRGRMQINSWWDSRLAAYGIHEHDLLTNGCTNIAVGAWILAQEYDRWGNWFYAFAAYNAGDNNIRAGYGYARKVIARWRTRYASRVRAVANR